MLLHRDRSEAPIPDLVLTGRPRTLELRLRIRSFRDHPLTGIGLDAYGLAFGRAPSPRERALSRDFLRAQAVRRSGAGPHVDAPPYARMGALVDLAHALFLSSELAFID